MPPRHVYWTIIFGNQPTAFRAATREELLPTLKQIQARHPDAVMMWFARGRLWQSEEEAREALVRRREEHRPRKPRFEDRAPRTGDAPPVKDRWRNRPPGTQGTPRAGDAARGRDWRPGGQHKDPRDRFKVPRDVKRARFKARRRWEPEAGSGKPDAGSGKPDAGSGKPEAGRRRLEAETAVQEAVSEAVQEERRRVIAHIVLLQPRADLTGAQRQEALATLERAAADVPEIRRFRLGRRVRHGLPGYEQLMPQDFEFALIIEVDDIEALKRYLQAPAHVALGQLFYTATSAALAYDYEF